MALLTWPTRSMAQGSRFSLDAAETGSALALAPFRVRPRSCGALRRNDARQRVSSQSTPIVLRSKIRRAYGGNMSLVRDEFRPRAPLLRWAGSKRQHLRHLLRLVPIDMHRYVEPFAGSACLYWALGPEKALLSDLNRELISLYEQVRDNPILVYNTYSGLKNTSDTYYYIRQLFQSEPNPTKRAGQFVFLNRYCFNGLYRTDKIGRFNVPYGGTKSGVLPTLGQLMEYSRNLAGVELRASDFSSAIRDVTKGDFVYLDPPFYSSTNRVFVSYTSTPFTRADLDRLEKALVQIDRAGAKFAVSYLDNDDIRPIASKWNQSHLMVLRRVSGFAAGRGQSREVVFTNYDIS
jgi:DNA adenine methylase